MRADSSHEIALLGGGCFWCVEALYIRIDGVDRARSGYAGGTTTNPTYHDVCAGTTGHAEVVEITFNPARISYRDILNLFWDIHDPTQLNRQGADVGTQYRSVIFYYTDSQREIAHHAVADQQQNMRKKIVTDILPAPHFYPAEDYHGQYYDKHPAAPYCRAVIAPKLRKLGK